jgi:hypothetical protein
MRAALFSYVWRHGEQCHGVDDRTGESCSSRGVVAHPVLVQERLRGWRCRGCLSGRCPQDGSRVPSQGSVRGTVAGMAASHPRASQQSRGCRRGAQHGAAVAGMAAQG